MSFFDRRYFRTKFKSLSIIVFTDSFSAGIVGTVNIAFLTSLVSKQFTATQYALLTSFMMLPGKVFSGFLGILADYFNLSQGQTMAGCYFYLHFNVGYTCNYPNIIK